MRLDEVLSLADPLDFWRISISAVGASACPLTESLGRRGPSVGRDCGAAPSDGQRLDQGGSAGQMELALLASVA